MDILGTKDFFKDLSSELKKKIWLIVLVYCNNNALLDHQSAPVYRKELLTLYPWLIPLINCGLGAVQVKRTVVELTASACTFPGGTVGTDPEEVKKKTLWGAGRVKD